MNLSVDFPLILTMLVLLAGIISLLDVLVLKKRRKAGRQPLYIEYSRSFFPILLVVWVIRSFIAQPYRVPTGSLEPTVMPGDFIVVEQYAYGLRLPVLHTKMLNIGKPKTGDLALFRWPVDPNIVFVKRVIGVPGDHVVYKNKVLYINGKEATQTLVGKGIEETPGELDRSVLVKTENLAGVKHGIIVRADGGLSANYDITVPKSMYFMMGDNRDDSEDSRMWGFVPESDLIGKAFAVWMSWDGNEHAVRWHRIGKKLK